MINVRKALRLSITGIVQGVGFRPFIYRLAISEGLNGFVKNMGGSEVEIWVEGEEGRLLRFIQRLRGEKPPSADIEELVVESVTPNGYSGFAIEKSAESRVKVSMIPPDFSICDECLRDILNPKSRFYRYPFHSCAWCGPRFSMIRKIPYDRENTAMSRFPLCSECLSEYNDPTNVRRFHAQGISCPLCGPRLFLVSSDGDRLDVKDPIEEAARLIEEGYIVAIKGIGGFHLAAKATDDDVVSKLRERKKRKTKPFALMALDIRIASELVKIDRKAKEVLLSPARPIVVLPRKTDRVSYLVAPGLKTIGVMLAYTPLHYLLLSSTRDRFLIMTSGNERKLPIVISNKEAVQKLSKIADYLLLHNREIFNRVDDSVIRFSGEQPLFIRRSRGYAPRWLRTVRRISRPVVALGAMLKNVGAIGFDRYVIPTQYIGDVDNLENLEFLRKALDFLITNYGLNLNDALVVIDKHPRYLTRILAKYYSRKYGCEVLSIQHHVAHIASVMLENNLSEVLGIAIDGAGYGDDGNIWGGEILYVSGEEYRRVGHLEYVHLPGGDLAAKYPVRIILALLADLGLEDPVTLLKNLDLVSKLPRGEREARLIVRTYKRSPMSSSLGRFLDAVSALLGICVFREYEGEPAIKLEESSWGGEHVGIKLEREGGKILIKEFFNRIVEEYLTFKKSIRDIGYTVQYEVGKALAEVCNEQGEKVLALSGGAAINSIILKSIRENFKGKVITNRKLPPGDGGISSGQVFLSSFYL